MAADALEELAEAVASNIVPSLAFAVHQGDAAAIGHILTGLTVQELYALAVVLAAQVPQPRTRPNDGVIDEVAVHRAATEQPGPLTRAERAEAVRLMARRGASVGAIAVHLHMNAVSVQKILDRQVVA